MKKIMIERWNSIVTVNDEIYILGDFLYKGTAKEANIILSKLNGKKYLIKGNHEKYLDIRSFKQEAFEWVKDYHVLKYKGFEFILFHFPILLWHNSRLGSIHLYGHVHNKGIRNPVFEEKLKALGPKAFNVGVDVNNFYPVGINQIIAKFS